MKPLSSLITGTIRKLTSRGRRRAAFWLSAGFLTAGLVFGGVFSAPAQTPTPSATTPAPADPAALTALRQRYQNLLADAGKPSMTRWLAALEILEKQRIADGDLDGAARVREKITSLRGTQPGGAAASANPGGLRQSILLRPAQAKTSPGVEFVDASKETARFKKAGASLEWDFTNVTPGLYEVRLTMGAAGPRDENDQPDPLQTSTSINPATESPVPVPPLLPRPDAAGGAVEFRRISNLGNGSSLLRRSIRPTGGWATFRTLSMGTILLDSRLARFSLRAGDCQALGLMDLRGVELAPAAPVNPASPGYPKELTRLREVYQKQFTELTKAVNTKYLKSLADLEAQLARGRDTDTLALVRQEKKRIERGGDDSQQAPMTFDLPVNDSLVTTIRGEARLTSQKDFLVRLRPAGGCEIIWKLTRLGIPPGTYKVGLDYRLNGETGGRALLFSMASGGTEPNPGLNIKIPGAGPVGTVLSLNPGNITIAKGSDHLFLRVTALDKNEGSLCDLKGLRLTPVTPSAP